MNPLEQKASAGVLTPMAGAEWVLPDTQSCMASGSSRWGAWQRGVLARSWTLLTSTWNLLCLSEHSALIQVANQFHHVPCQVLEEVEGLV